MSTVSNGGSSSSNSAKEDTNPIVIHLDPKFVTGGLISIVGALIAYLWINLTSDVNDLKTRIGKIEVDIAEIRPTVARTEMNLDKLTVKVDEAQKTNKASLDENTRMLSYLIKMLETKKSDSRKK